ncbi:hypothetical protein RhiirA5_353486 [Rhizophagus irregularis]|uniref:Uncharacterized protein n=3 Tax=Rhizophagus irregularis TaxID=588596 RepID=U9T5C2_RHIID|nr:hypothetical protein GLOIN_2v1529178 [Rhizophagus irregularis DAOM 181602=DAOM 197198]EXX70087.1 hypothetical protein RirG_090560 [Rhizophagus irregularis DAOM 197198w]PKC07599.1 hypothetical protein RhiirA5_358978 [Rhizophagus irregularis]PKC12025.1 hypothetical protein RhiirA5_353486 [Rhizophagus irregularis]PKC74986.1 hypothetical protein RhiirA1_408350 [Rhizophagus irregularis]PKY21594.1 hypothetical protein RhiirB3_409608 [Rhizophagus irregularis]|eukprot:XP_025186121.1 hypothetical protein GLOIN_2v1529178 [Rhizophagus irregularis DAOM 181602=DAOM 197198]
MARYPLAIKIANVFVYIFLLGSNVYSGLFNRESENSPYGGKHLTYISPAPFVFGVWGLIHFLLGGFVIYQWFGDQDLVLDGINWHFVNITLLNTLWLALWHNDHLILSWIVILITTIPVSMIYAVIKRRDGNNINEIIWIRAPFSLYHAWILVIAFISTFAAFANDKKNDDSHPSLVVKIFVVIALLILAKLGTIGYLYKGKGDIAGSIVIAWYLYGVAVEQNDQVIHWTALVLAIISSIVILGSVIQKIRNRHSEESTPLIGGV